MARIRPVRSWPILGVPTLAQVEAARPLLFCVKVGECLLEMGEECATLPFVHVRLHGVDKKRNILEVAKLAATYLINHVTKLLTVVLSQHLEMMLCARPSKPTSATLSHHLFLQIPVHYVGSATHINQAKLRLQGWDPLLEPNFHFHDFPTPHFHSPPPDPDASVQFPAHLQPCLRHLQSFDFVGIGNAESYTFHSVSVFSIFFFFWESLGRPALEGHEFKKLSSGNLYYTSKLIEGPMWIYFGKRRLMAPKSVLLVSFGTSTSLTDEQIKELAIGLERSGHKFIWLLRDADKGDIFSEEVRRSELPEGYEERMKETGMGWCMGVPIAAWPMHSDQPRNAALVTQVLQVGLAVKEWAEREQLVAASAIEKAVRRLMASEEGNAMRKKAQQLGNPYRGQWKRVGFLARSWMVSLLTSLDSLASDGGILQCDQLSPCIRQGGLRISLK
ncbi:Zeatin O-glucosyltransferase [Vitis vinifera]|uniref:Zeatin O-glucosyltransferase n=1 Tax=Vitis vinifera TaxID=29760 RepID=A0A438JL47_VITVI|nr:Zeatin O-glucosyltransferase [Vitis vinifera]